MWDNATGSAAILSIAKAFTELPAKPKRSVVFVCLTGEEKGILGSNFFVQKYLEKGYKIVANINIDMVGNLFDVKDVIPLGYSHSNLSDAVDFAANHSKLVVDDNKREEYNYIERSDQIAFIKQGIPALNIGTGYHAVDPKIDAAKATDKWMKRYYHSPQDDLNQNFTEKGFMDNVKFNFLTAFYIAENLGEIKWNEEGWLYKRYLAEEKK